jgi:hypothetical protein
MARICNCCGQSKDIADFPVGNVYINKAGEVKTYKKKTCKPCYAGQNRNTGRERKRDKISRLINWPSVAAALVIVTGIYSHDYLSGRNRICFYETMYGDQVLTIDAMNMCPISMEFEI